jgi:hypothetical protein
LFVLLARREWVVMISRWKNAHHHLAVDNLTTQAGLPGMADLKFAAGA